jgi:hypothetical protein
MFWRKLATLGTSQAARELIAQESEFSRAQTDASRSLAALKTELSKEQFRLWRKAVRSGVKPSTAHPAAVRRLLAKSQAG